MWRLATVERVTALGIETTNGSIMLPDRGWWGQLAIFDPAALEVGELPSGVELDRYVESWRILPAPE